MNPLRLFLLVLLPALLLLSTSESAEMTSPAIFLVAKPELMDPNFAQSVVLVVFPKETGPVGVILNRPTRITVKEAFPDDQQLKSHSETVYMGGPVQLNMLMFLFRRAAPPDTAFPVVDDLYLSGDGKLLDELLSRGGPAPVQRYFLGYSGWAATQLDMEIAAGGWYVVPAADLDTVLKADPKTMWRNLLLRATAVKT